MPTEDVDPVISWSFKTRKDLLVPQCCQRLEDDRVVVLIACEPDQAATAV